MTIAGYQENRMKDPIFYFMILFIQKFTFEILLKKI